MRSGIDTTRLRTMLQPNAPKALVLGRQRNAVLTKKGVEFRYRDQPVVILRPAPKAVVLSLCGIWSTATTRAMNEYLSALGLSDIRPSLAGGQFHAMRKGKRYTASYDNTIQIEI